MAAGVIKSGGGGGVVAAASRVQPMAEINITPFVDVMLVLVDHLYGRRAVDDRGRASGTAKDRSQCLAV